jgi:SAM-dependent methyltransferase
VTREERWLEALWPEVRSHLPPPPARIVEVGCGRLGGFVPRLVECGYQALGIDPAAPDGERYLQIEFERSNLSERLDGVVACTSLHHVGDPAEVLDKMASALVPGAPVVVVEWDWENFDEATARWCFERLVPGVEDGWLQRRRDEWLASGQAWQEYLRGWANQHGLHGGQRLVRELDQRFERLVCDRGPYCFTELAETTQADELAAIASGQIQAIRIDYVGRRA